MIGLFAPNGALSTAKLVLAALRRSVSRGQAHRHALAATDDAMDLPDLLVAVSPDERLGEFIVRRLDGPPCKLIVFGNLPEVLAERLGVVASAWPDDPAVWGRSLPAQTHAFSQSRGGIVYRAPAKALGADGWQRPLERFDFTDEWNNLGFGAVRVDGSQWALAAPLRVPADAEIARLEVGGVPCGSYSGLFDSGSASLLWFNRPVGPIDSFEWALVERFLADYRADELPCQPVLGEVPAGHDAAVTMRLDCDEDIESARPLWQRYSEWGIPFSLAVHTTNLQERRHDAIVRELNAAGGSLLSHTATHAPDWGGSYDHAMREALESSRAIAEVTGCVVDYAVSPFHQSPHYALAALADAGYRGCIGGIIRNDPHFLLARGGELADLPRGFVGHSQQCMLHGDCLLDAEDPIAIYRRAFDRAHETGTLFGYLDHPFSERYAYGWTDEATRIAIHEAFIEHIRTASDAPLFLAENAALDWLCDRAQTRVVEEGMGYRVVPGPGRRTLHRLAVRWRGEVTVCDASTALA